MQSLNLWLLHWMAAGDEPGPWTLFNACVLARYGATLCAVAMAWVAWRRPGERGCIAAALLTAGAASLLSHAIATRLGLPRPFVLGLTPAYISHGASGALPSAHACAMAVVALVFLQRAALRDVGLPLLALASATGWARVYVGVHFPFDILAGFLLAAVLAGLFATADHALRWAFRPGSVPRSAHASGWKRS